MSVTPEDTARHLRAMQSRRSRLGEERAARLRQRFPEARDLLLGRFGVKRAWVFGSLVVGSATDESDVDLAAEGLDSDSYFPALAALMAIFGAPVDLVRIEDAPPSLLERILAEGRPL